jgi:hypothetical protein
MDLAVHPTIHHDLLRGSGAFTKVATISSGMSGVMELQWELQASRLWVVCDDTCSGQHRTMQVDATGAFALPAVYPPPQRHAQLQQRGLLPGRRGRVRAGSKPVYL